MSSPRVLSTSFEERNDLNGSLGKAKMGMIRRIRSSASFQSLAEYNLQIQLLNEDETVMHTFKKNTTGRDILEYVCQKLDLEQKDFFGLRYNNSFHRYWLDLDKLIAKEFHSLNLVFSFRFRFYPMDPVHSCCRVTKNQLFIQLQRDLLHGRLQCNQNVAAQLGGLALQANLGDYIKEKDQEGYVSSYKLVLKQSEKLESKIAECHKSYNGMTSEEACDEFLRVASDLDTYGFDPYSVKTLKGEIDTIIGAGPRFVFVFVQNQQVYKIPWSFVQDIDYRARQLKITVTEAYLNDYLVSENTVKPQLILNNLHGISSQEALTFEKVKRCLRFICPKASFAKNIWLHLMGQKVFFNESSAKNFKPKTSFSKWPLMRGSTFRLPTNRTMQEIKETGESSFDKHNDEHLRYTLPRQKPRDLSLHKPLITEAFERTTFENTTAIEEVSSEAEKTPEPQLIVNQLDDSIIDAPVIDLVSAIFPTKPNTVIPPQKHVMDVVHEIEARNGHVVDHPPSVVHREVKPISPLKSEQATILRKLTSFLLTFVLLSMLFTVIAFVLFDSPNSITSSFPSLNHIRRDFYLPIKTQILNKLR